MKLRLIAYLLNVIIGLTIGIWMYQCKQGRVNPKYDNNPDMLNNQKEYFKEKGKSKEQIFEYHYTIDDAYNELNLSNYQRVRWRNEEPLHLSASQIRNLNGTYIWESKIYFRTQREMFDYICEHFEEMQKYKVSSSSVTQKSGKSVKNTNIYDEYQDRLDDYLDDPEDEIEFDPDVFDFQDD